MIDFQRAGITAAAAYAAAYALKSTITDLKYFKSTEFGVWWPFIDGELLRGLDLFRDSLGERVTVSPAAGSIGRASREAESSQHYFLSGGKVRAIDILIPESVSLSRAYMVARELNVFSGIGVYPDWLPRHGMHLDTRQDRAPENPATWSGIKTASGQVYKSLQEGLA